MHSLNSCLHLSRLWMRFFGFVVVVSISLRVMDFWLQRYDKFQETASASPKIPFVSISVLWKYPPFLQNQVYNSFEDFWKFTILELIRRRGVTPWFGAIEGNANLTGEILILLDCLFPRKITNDCIFRLRHVLAILSQQLQNILRMGLVFVKIFVFGEIFPLCSRRRVGHDEGELHGRPYEVDVVSPLL